MPVCSYLVIAADGEAGALATRLSGMHGCEVTPAENADVLILVTETAGPEAEAVLRARLEDMEGMQALLLTFGELENAVSGGLP